MSAKSNKENQEAEEQAELQSVASPRISSTGAGGSEDPQGSSTHRASRPSPAQAFAQGFDHNDFIHWAGVGHRSHDARSIASSAAADRDDKSIYEEPGGGALDAHHEEGEEDGHHEDEDEEEEEPEEITLTQVQDQLPGVHLRSESSNVESTYGAMSGPGSLADVVDQLADQAVAGELSPRQAAAAIRSATRQHSGEVAAAVAGGGGGDAAAGSPDADADADADAATDALTMDDASDSVSASGVGQSSMAPSEEGGWQQGGASVGAGGDAGGSTLAASAAPAEGSGSSSSGGDDTHGMESISLDGGEPLAAAAAEAGAAAEEAAAAQQMTKERPAAEAEQEVEEQRQQPAPAAAAEETAVEAGQQGPAVGSDGAGDQPSAEATGAGGAGVGAAAAAAAAVAGGVQHARTASSNYRSQLMQELTATSANEEDDITVYSSAEPSSAGASSALPPLQQAAEQPAQAQKQALGNGAAAVPAAARQGSSRMEALSVDASASASAAPSSGSGAGGNSNSAAHPPVMSEADAAAALAAINAAGRPQAPAQQGEQQQAVPLLFPQAWYETFKGLLYMDGIDSLGRPVVVLNADSVPSNMKSSALVFVKAHLEPLVNQGDYVLVFTSRGQAKLPSMWIMGAYRSLPRPFRKHVQYIVLVRPSAFLRAVLAFMRPFVSKKAGRKIKQVQSVHEIADATDGEVTVQSLGSAFAADQAAAEGAAEHAP